MSLAQHLAELAAANAKGLLSDDEFRILRQSAFDHYAQPSSPAKVLVVQTPPDGPPTPPPPLRHKKSVVFGVSTLLRRATSRSKASSDRLSDPPSPSDPSKLGVIPRLHKKASGIFSIPKHAPSPAPTVPSSPPPSLSLTLPSPPFRPRKSVISPKQYDTYPLTSDIFDDRNLHTAADIRAAISTTETEARRLLHAFNSLQSSTSIRVQQQTARRLPSATPSSISVLLDGTEWRDHSPHQQSSPASTPRPSPISLLSDGVSVHSGSSSHKSIVTTLSQSKSLSSLQSKQPSISPRSPSRPSIARKPSVSSIASQTPSTMSRLVARRSLSTSKSTSHLALSILPEGGTPEITDDAQNAEVSEIRRRREEVMARYNARLEYLRAKLKSAELHEKLLRR